jgi:hypothetical protein
MKVEVAALLAHLIGFKKIHLRDKIRNADVNNFPLF